MEAKIYTIIRHTFSCVYAVSIAVQKITMSGIILSFEILFSCMVEGKSSSRGFIAK